MVRIENITVDGSIIKFDYFPEDNNKKGYVEYDTDKREYLKYEAPEEYEYNKHYAMFAIRRIMDAIKDNENLAGKLYCMWY